MAENTGVNAALDAVEGALAGFDAALRDAASSLTRDEWLRVVGRSQGVVNRVTGLQDAAIAELACIEGVWCEDGTLGEVRRGPGRVALDAADLVAPRLGVSHHRAQQRVETAVRLTGREPVPVDADASPTPTGLERLHSAMRAGRLDEYRASVVAGELVEAPADVADAVVTALDPHLDTEPPAVLRRRVRRMLARISPDLLRQRAERARRETGLRRWVAEPGVDAWFGTFPSEQSAAAWAAVDRLARQYVTDGTCSTIEQARGRALTDLVTQQADIRVRLVVTRPVEAAVGSDAAPCARAESGPAAGTPGPERGRDLVQVHGLRPSEPALVGRDWLERLVRDPATEVVEQPCHPSTGALLDPGGLLTGDGYRPGAELSALVRARDGRCRFPGCSVAARFCDLDHVRPWPAGPTAAANLLCLCRRHHRIKQSPGWRLRLEPDAVAVWTDPTGRLTRTAPVDTLDRLVLPAALPPSDAPARGWAGRAATPALPSVLEEHHGHRLEARDALQRRRRCTHAPASTAVHRRRRVEQVGDPPF